MSHKTLTPRPYPLTPSSGYITAALLVSAAVASIVLYGLAFLVINQYQIVQRQHHIAKAHSIAEAGINYYRWHLAHAPTDFKDGTNQPGPYIHDYIDPQGSKVGTFSLNITPPGSGSSTLTLSSTGSTIDYPDITQTITVKYGKQSFVQYAFLYNSNIWFTPGLTINGPVHSNGGIRNDAINTSTINSALDTYSCDNKSGCSPTVAKPGVWGAGGDQSLWQYPVTPVDFNALAIDFTQMKSTAQSTGLYLAPSNKFGYHLVFNSNGTFDAYTVTQANKFKVHKPGAGCENIYGTVKNQTLTASYPTAGKKLIFVEDNLWVDGTVTSPVTIVAATFPIDTNSVNIWLNDNLVYPAKDGTAQLGIIAQKDIFFGRDIPTNFEINAALMAQTGSILRHDYSNSNCAHDKAKRDSLTIYGSIIAAVESTWNWGADVGSGFLTRTLTYDTHLRNTPPPYFPTTGGYDITSWTE